MKKTIEQWYQELLEPYKSQALRNMNPVNGKELQDDMYSAIAGGFIWEFTPEGKKYWRKLAYHYKEAKK